MKNNLSIKLTVFFMLSGHLLLGIAYIAILPPWEGFDETAHYSSLQQIADKNTLPRYGSARISKDVEKYSDFAPIPYSGSPPVEENGGYTYKSFFDSQVDVVQRGSNHINSDPKSPRYYTEGENFNWQSQHPPLSYLIFAPIYLLTKSLSWSAQLFVIRLISYFFAWIALVIGVYTCLTFLKLHSNSGDMSFKIWVLLGFGIWPLIFPSWFTDMARIGNDSLCALLIALIWWVVLKFRNNSSFKLYVALGILFGIGCLIKAFFLPVLTGISVYIFLLRWEKEGRTGIKYNLLHLLVMISIVTIMSGWWYYLNWYHYGVILGSDEMIRLKNTGGLLTNLYSNFSFSAWLRGLAAAITTFAWSGTWSFARLPYIFLFPMSLMVIFLIYIYLYKLRQYKITMIECLPVWFTLPVLAGFGYHVLVRIALIGEGRGTGGYYLHFLVIPLVIALGVGLKNIWNIKSIRILGSILFIYALIFSTIVYFLQIFLFTGMMHISGDSKFYKLSKGFASLFNLLEIKSRLDVLAFPIIGLSTLILGLIFVALSLRLMLNKIKKGMKLGVLKMEMR